MGSMPSISVFDMGGMMGGMGMEGHVMQNMTGMNHANMTDMKKTDMAGMDHSNMAGMDHSNMGGMSEPSSVDPTYVNGSGLIPRAYNGGKFLSYADLTAARPRYKYRKPSRTI